MSQVLDEMLAVLNDENVLEHYGMPRRSGRYPWGSGEEPYQHGSDFLSRVNKMRKEDFVYVDDNGKINKYKGNDYYINNHFLASYNVNFCFRRK